jgi:hypothetical protein
MSYGKPVISINRRTLSGKPSEKTTEKSRKIRSSLKRQTLKTHILKYKKTEPGKNDKNISSLEANVRMFHHWKQISESIYKLQKEHKKKETF